MNQKGTKPGSPGVVQVVRIIKSVGAAVAACAVLSGCAGDNVDEGDPGPASTSPVITETQASPWDLPIEDRPELFDPCTEIPIGALEDALDGVVVPQPDHTIHSPGEMLACSWKNKEVRVGVLSTWKTKDEYLADKAFAIESENIVVQDRPGLRVSDTRDRSDRSCTHLLFTSRGTVWLRADLIGGLREFRGTRLAKACEIIDDVISPLISPLPEGDF